MRRELRTEGAIAPQRGQPAVLLAGRRYRMCQGRMASRSSSTSPPVRVGGHLAYPWVCPAVALVPPCGGGCHWCLSPRLHGPEPKLRPDKSPVDVPSLYRPLRRVMWITSVFQLCTERYAIFPGGRLDKGIRRYRRPQHFSACPQACCLFAHVMHRFMHRKARQQDSYRARRRPAELRRRLYDIAAASS